MPLGLGALRGVVLEEEKSSGQQVTGERGREFSWEKKHR